MDSSLKGKTALITGCNGGIGRSLLTLFAQNGANIYACVRKDNTDFSTFIKSLEQTYHVAIKPLYFDLRDESAIKDALTPLIKEKKSIDILINNAAVATGGLMQMTSMQQLKEVFQINYFSQVLITQLVSKILVRQKSGSIINIGSVAGLDNFAGYTSYGSSKAALMAFTRTIARELAIYNIRVNAVAPSVTETDMSSLMDNKTIDEMVQRSDLKRLGKTDEIANFVLYLASDQASFITGQVYRIDGGM
jgi:3-oxoacyl-[acyl-carrier protein] reductase